MKKIIIDPAFWELFPAGQINCLVLENIDNQVEPAQTEYFTQLLEAGAKDAQRFLGAETFSENEVVAQWRQAFSRFKTKKGARSSIEALLKRVQQGRSFTPINPLVDIYNSISLKYGIPLGGEDIAAIVGDLHLGKAHGGESFLPLGAEVDAPALPGELIYYDEAGAVCRCLNWREAQRTMLTEKTKQAILVTEAINPEQAARCQAALQEVKQLVEDYFKTESRSYVLTKANPEAVIG